MDCCCRRFHWTVHRHASRVVSCVIPLTKLNHLAVDDAELHRCIEAFTSMQMAGVSTEQGSSMPASVFSRASTEAHMLSWDRRVHTRATVSAITWTRSPLSKDQDHAWRWGRGRASAVKHLFNGEKYWGTTRSFGCVAPVQILSYNMGHRSANEQPTNELFRHLWFDPRKGRKLPAQIHESMLLFGVFVESKERERQKHGQCIVPQ